MRAPCRGRTGILLVESQVRYPLLQRSMITSWPPRSRTERYRLIRAAPSTGWVVASCCHSIDLTEESGGPELATALYASVPLSGAAPASLTGSTLRGRWQRTENSNLTVVSRRPVSGRWPARLAGFVLHGGRWPTRTARCHPAHPLSNESPAPCPVHLPCAGRESNPHVRRQTLLGRARLPFTPPALGPADCAGVGEDLGVLGGSRTRNRRLLKPTSVPELEYEHASRRPVPTRVVRRTKAEPQPCAAASLPPVDLNQDFAEPESGGPAGWTKRHWVRAPPEDSNPEHTD